MDETQVRGPGLESQKPGKPGQVVAPLYAHTWEEETGMPMVGYPARLEELWARKQSPVTPIGIPVSMALPAIQSCRVYFYPSCFLLSSSNSMKFPEVGSALQVPFSRAQSPGPNTAVDGIQARL